MLKTVTIRISMYFFVVCTYAGTTTHIHDGINLVYEQLLFMN